MKYSNAASHPFHIYPRESYHFTWDYEKRTHIQNLMVVVCKVKNTHPLFDNIYTVDAQYTYKYREA